MAETPNSDDDRRHLASQLYHQYRREIRRPFEHTRFIPQLIREFYVDEETFKNHFGIYRFAFKDLHKKLDKKIRRHHTKFQNNISSKDRLAIVLRFLASGDSYEKLSKHYKIPLHTLPIMIQEVSKTISQYLRPRVMPYPTKKMWKRNAEDFKKLFDMPNCIGAIEGKKLSVKGKRVALLALVDARDRFIMIDVGPCQQHYYRGNVMDNSVMGQMFLHKEMNVPSDRPISANTEPLPYVILGSSLFPPKPYLLTKYSKQECAINETCIVFNTRLSRAKITVNRALIQLRNRWKLFKGPLHVPMAWVEQIILTCCCLQNYFILRTNPLPFPHEPDSNIAITQDRLDSLVKLLPEKPNNVRDKFNAYFMSPEGLVPWQWHEIINSNESSSDDNDITESSSDDDDVAQYDYGVDADDDDDDDDM